ncbi:barstar family protein [Aromatoleum buckelii]|uniref:Barstar (barnase inhibitor) domain-containing protein n=1 Tax=Aromatoleum buckelii TaxID=200254 RepID=A0ABX1N3H5_9RHOO|nr:barstar family protein [Aromatoleum buckelii]MCK0510774.1 barstar family protein [Aromatoleum buckelii]
MIAENELASVLQQPDRAGVYHLPQRGGNAITQAARELDFRVLRVDLSGCADKADFLARIAAGLHFPDWFGQNWDALADCLADMAWLPADGYVIILEHADRFRVAAEADFIAALETFDEAAREQAADGIPVWIFVGLTANGIVHLRTL